MRPLVPISLATALAVALAACSPPPSEPVAPKAPAANAPAAAPVAEAPKPVEAAAPVKEIPEGECGDQSKVAADQRVFNTARWSTASEQNNFGFDVWRGDTEKGEFAKLTKEPILGAGTSDETHKYEFRDDTIDPCKEYWYYIEQTNTDGSKEKISPVFKAPAKRRAVGSPAPQPVAPAKE
jgi:hypothetical protein